MKYEEEYNKLSDRIAWNNCQLVVDVLQKNVALDVTHNNGKFFILAIENNSPTIVKLLLDYFEKNQLSLHKANFYEYHILKNKMRDILEIAIEDVELSPEMKEALSSYLNFEDSNNDIENLSDLSGNSFDIEEHNTLTKSLLTEENLTRFTREFVSQEKIDYGEEIQLIGENSFNCTSHDPT